MNNLKERTKGFALEIIKLVSELPQSPAAKVIGNQVLRSGTSVGANYREAMRARSTAEFVSKLGIVKQELAETEYWFELLEESKILPGSRITELKTEINELLAMTVASAKTARRRK